MERKQFFHETAHCDLGSGFLGDTADINVNTYFREKRPYTQNVAPEFPVNYQVHSGNVAFESEPDTPDAVALSSFQVTV